MYSARSVTPETLKLSAVTIINTLYPGPAAEVTGAGSWFSKIIEARPLTNIPAIILRKIDH